MLSSVEEDERRAATHAPEERPARGLPPAARGAAVAMLAGLYLAGAVSQPSRWTFALVLASCALPIVWPPAAAAGPLPGPRRAPIARALGPALAVAAALVLGTTFLRGPGGAATTALLLLAIGLLAGLLHVALPPRGALAASLAPTALLYAAAVPRQGVVAAALAAALRGATLWGTLAWLAVGIAGLALLERRPAASARLWPALLVYGLAEVGLAAWWQWGGPRAALAALPLLRANSFEARSAGFVPLFIVIGAAAQLLAAGLLRARRWPATALADLCTQFVLLALPLVALVAGQRRPIPVEDNFHIAWLGGLLVVLVGLRAVVAVALLLRAAGERDLPERRLALALCAVCLAVYCPAAALRSINVGQTGDEPQYLAAAETLWREHNLEITDAIFSPDRTGIPGDNASYRQIDIQEDNSRDRMTATAPATAVTSAFFPLAGGAGLDTTVELVNPGAEAAGVTVTYRAADGRVAATQTATVAPGQTATLRTPAATGGPLSATVAAGKPVVAALRVGDQRQGDEQYTAMAAIPRACLPVLLDHPGWQARILVQNALPGAARATWQFFEASGAARQAQPFTIPPDGIAAIPLPPDAGLGAVCVAADGPVATLLVARGAPGFIVQPAQSAQAQPITIPAPPRSFSTTIGHSQVLVYNPGDRPVGITIHGLGPDRALAIPPHGTQEVTNSGTSTISGQTHDLAAHTTIVPTAPVVVGVRALTGGQVAGLAPDARPADSAVLPVLNTGSDRHIIGQLLLANQTPTDTMVTATLTAASGAVLWHDKLWVCAGCNITHPFWYTASGQPGAALTLETREPVTASLMQREVVTAWPGHSIGISLLILPGFAVAGWLGALATTVVIAALLAMALYGLLRDLGVTRRTALLVTAVLALSSPLVTYAVQIYPEVAAALLLVVAVRLIAGGPLRDRWRLPAALACLVAVPLLHTRLLPPALIGLVLLAGVLLARWRGHLGRLSGRQRLLALAATAGVTAFALALVWVIEPRAHPDALRRYLDVSTLVPHALGVLFDRGTGLLPNLPVLLLAGAGFVWAIRRAPAIGWGALGLALVQLAFVALRRDGWEVWSPPGRYILPAVPFLGVALAAAWDRGFYRPVRYLAYALIAWGALIAAFYVWVPSGAYYVPQPLYWFTDDILRALLGLNPLRLFPPLSSVTPVSLQRAALVVAVLVVGALLGVRWRRPRGVVSRQSSVVSGGLVGTPASDGPAGTDD
ncbi:MAG TPA: DUF5719 family protein [Thermomicrobiales bacterium]|nr:DUF5719 family protein [Thermomicrobiales bacterium]